MSNNFFSFKQFTIRQDRCAMKVGTDGALLGAWADVPRNRTCVRILDAGTGTGLIALMMAQRFANATVMAIDIDAEAVAQATENIQASPFSDRVRAERIALQDMSEGIFDAIVCNPPYFIDSLKCPDERRSTARHAATLTYDELMSSAYRLLADDGQLSIVIPSDCLDAMNSAAAIAGFFTCRICSVKTTERKPARRYLVAYTKTRSETPSEEPALVIGSDGFNRMMGDFYLKL